MKMSFFPRLAWTGIRKNRALYVPYILTCTGMVMMYYIMQSLSTSPLLSEMRGGTSMGIILSLGRFVIAVFALIFLFYTNSFLIRRRYKEFGLYNVLGMDKRAICRLLAWESLIVDAIALAGGLVLGIALSKLAELGLLNAVRADVDFRFTLSGQSILLTAGIFLVIFLLLFMKSLWQVGRSNPLELLRSENAGEKPPRANWVLAVIGVVLLLAAYGLAVSIKSPLAALTWFFVAVIMVIVATYLLFISGSVALCRLLQKKKDYYYQKKHFVSVSSMVYRMKRNGAGLASICILSTMVLVMISSSSSLYFGENESLSARFPRENEVAVFVQALDDLAEDRTAQIRKAYEKVFAAYNVTPKNVTEYGYASITAKIKGTSAEPDPNANQWSMDSYDDLRTLYFIGAADYNRLMGTSLTLQPGQAMIYPIRCTYEADSLSVGNVDLEIVGHLDAFFPSSDAVDEIVPNIMLVVPDLETVRPLEELRTDYGERMLMVKSYYGYDLDVPDDKNIEVFNAVTDALGGVEALQDEEGGYGYSASCLAMQKNDFFGTYGGLFFLGIMLSIVFIFAAAMIIYYKQVSEGYEDQSRFAIMRKVGMTREDIKKSINSQVLTVFFAPLLLSGVHLAFAFPLVWKILMIFGLHNLKFVILVTVGAFLVFGIFYAIIYKATARTYYNIVSASEEA